VRDVLLTSGRGVYGYEDVTGLPWIEIDTAADLARAKSEVFPQIVNKLLSNHPAPGLDDEVLETNRKS
jgi:hypothetical protein